MSDILGDWKRTHYCGELRKEDIGKEVCIMGWVHRRRDHGGLIFIDLRDRTGIGQLALDPDRDPEAHTKAEAVRNEFVVAAIGKVSPRPEGTVNPKMATGEVEVEISEIRILNPAKTPPFMLDEFTEVAENLRLKYRYLDLRREGIQQNQIMRHKVAQTVRNYLTEKDFLEIETPMLTKSTPEGARDYLVPSRVNLGNFYALPQSPQIFKQLCMVGGLATRMCTSLAPASRIICTIFIDVVPRTIESSISTIRLPSTNARLALCLRLTPEWRAVSEGWMNVRPT